MRNVALILKGLDQLRAQTLVACLFSIQLD